MLVTFSDHGMSFPWVSLVPTSGYLCRGVRIVSGKKTGVVPCLHGGDGVVSMIRRGKHHGKTIEPVLQRGQL
jgi:hypothetical protein